LRVPSEISLTEEENKKRDSLIDDSELTFDLLDQFKRTGTKRNTILPPKQDYNSKNSVLSITEESVCEDKEDIILITNDLSNENKKQKHIEFLKSSLSGAVDNTDQNSRLRVRTTSLEDQKSINIVLNENLNDDTPTVLKIARRFSLDGITPTEQKGQLEPTEVHIIGTRVNKKNQTVTYEKNLSIKGALEINKRGQTTL
jgi:hypothetical protein